MCSKRPPREDSADPREQGAAALAFVGDGVLSLLVRARLAKRGRASAGALHRAAVKMVSAESQAAALPLIEPLLTGEEAAVLRRGRNANKPSGAKNASARDYRASTGLEALLGWLYLCGKTERLEEIFEMIWLRYLDGTANDTEL